ncbi:hypothetical protein BDV97DRAFT_401330 [Delphinella strobiligena]|nr:hypothetical protein BDV97DRAFT_401330 [Delphinella strobiligena]
MTSTTAPTTADPSKLDAPKLSDSYNNPLFSDLMVEVGTGAEMKTIHVHKVILMHANRFLHNCVAGHWKEAKEGIIRFPHDDYELINIWLGRYYGVELSGPDEGGDEWDPAAMLDLVKLYYFADSKSDHDTGEKILQKFEKMTDPDHQVYEPDEWMDMGLVAAIDVVFDDTNAPKSLYALRLFFVRAILPMVCQLKGRSNYDAIYDARPRLGAMLLAKHIEYMDGDADGPTCDSCRVCTTFYDD